jgi:hypothetical protein
MSGGIANDIRLGLNNTTADDAFGQLTHQYLPNEIAGERGGIDWQLRARERRTFVLMAVSFMVISVHGIRSTHCAREGPGSNGSPILPQDVGSLFREQGIRNGGALTRFGMAIVASF